MIREKAGDSQRLKLYLPDPDETLETGKGICFDYAALMVTMLRSQRIPARLEIGYAGTVYHAWISAYVDDIGWVDGIIQFTNNTWTMMDPTFASSGKGDKEIENFITKSGQLPNHIYLLTGGEVMQLTNKELATFFEQMAMILHSGIPPLRDWLSWGKILHPKKAVRS